MNRKINQEDIKLFGQSKSIIDGELPDREVIHCPLCNLQPNVFAVDYQGFNLARCPRCNLEFLSPRPLFEKLVEKVYKRNYHPKENISASEIFRKTHYSRQLNLLKQILRKRKSILDVGCGDGSFLYYAREHGWQVSGIDIHLSPSLKASGIPLWAGELREVNFEGKRFDAIRFHHVLEHTQDPLLELKEARKLIKTDGVLLLSVPNLAGISLRVKSWQSRLGLKKHRWRHYAAVHHLWFFAPSTLRALVEAARFKVVYWETPVPKTKRIRPSLFNPSIILLESFRVGSILDFYCLPR